MDLPRRVQPQLQTIANVQFCTACKALVLWCLTYLRFHSFSSAFYRWYGHFQLAAPFFQRSYYDEEMEVCGIKVHTFDAVQHGSSYLDYRQLKVVSRDSLFILGLATLLYRREPGVYCMEPSIAFYMPVHTDCFDIFGERDVRPGMHLVAF